MSKITQLHGIDPHEFTELLLNAFRDELRAFKSEKGIQPQREPPEYLTRTEAAKLLKISTVTLNEWAKKGIVKRKRIGNLARYELSELNNAIKYEG